MTLPTQRVLQAMLTEPTEEMSALQIGQAAELPSSAVYPILARLEACGWLDSRWEDIDPAREGRHRRRCYHLRPQGVELARQALTPGPGDPLQGATAQQGAPADGTPASGLVPRKLVALATRLLPPRERPRYGEEFHVELSELPSREQLRYALRVLANAGRLRRALLQKASSAGGWADTSSGLVVRGVAGALIWLASGTGVIGSTAVAIAVQPALLVALLVTLAPLALLPLLISILALIAVYAPSPERRAAAERVLDRLLLTLRPGRRQGR